MTQWTARLGYAAALTLALSAVAGGAAFAQIDTHSKAPIDITADQAEVSNAQCSAVWRGSAEAIQEKTRLRADTITVYSRKKEAGADGKSACGGAERIEADGHVYYVTAERNARGDHAVYNQARDEIVITGDVIVVQGLDVARGARLTINTATKEARMDAKTGADGKPGRVRAVFYPDKTNPPAGTEKP